MFGKKKYTYLEVNGDKYLCAYWYSKDDKLWYGESIDTSLYPTTCQAENYESLVEKLKKQIEIDLKTANQD